MFALLGIDWKNHCETDLEEHNLNAGLEDVGEQVEIETCFDNLKQKQKVQNEKRQTPSPQTLFSKKKASKKKRFQRRKIVTSK